MEVEAKTHSKGRKQEEKVGRIKYTLEVQKKIFHEIQEIKLMQRTILAGFAGSGMLHFEKSYIEKIACVDEVDSRILELLHQAGGAGLFPRDVAKELSFYKLTRFHVTRRLQRMNKRLEKEIGESVAERHGWHWALTSFTYGIWNELEVEKSEAVAGLQEETEFAGRD